MTEVSFLTRVVRMLFGSWASVLLTAVLLVVMAVAIYRYVAWESTRDETKLPFLGTGLANDGRLGGSSSHTVGAAKVPVHPMGLFSEHTTESMPFPIEAPAARVEDVPAWWEKPVPLTPKELGFLDIFQR